MKRGLLSGGVILVLGIALQLTVGPVPWARMAFPVNLIILLLSLAFLGAAFSLRRRVPLFDWLTRPEAAVPAFCYALVLTILSGLVVQHGDAGGHPWFSHMLGWWPFVLTYAWLMIVSGMTVLCLLSRFQMREIPLLLLHGGLFVAMVCGSLGHPDIRRLQMTLKEGEAASWQAEDAQGAVQELPFGLALHDFIMEEYPLQPGQKMATPRRFASEVTVHPHKGSPEAAVIEVNKPLKVSAWKIYQYDYDAEAGPESEISILELVHDPWLAFVYAGIFLMLAGALSVFFFMAPQAKEEERQ